MIRNLSIIIVIIKNYNNIINSIIKTILLIYYNIEYSK